MDRLKIFGTPEAHKKHGYALQKALSSPKNSLSLPKQGLSRAKKPKKQRFLNKNWLFFLIEPMCPIFLLECLGHGGATPLM